MAKFEPPKPPRPRGTLPPAPPWLELALKERGVKEAPGRADNPRIIEYLRCTNLKRELWHDSTAHCAAFGCWLLEHTGLPNPRYARARMFLRYGIRLPQPRLGCFVVLWRGAPEPVPGKPLEGDGHLGLWLNDTAERFNLFGANQDNTVCEKLYPKARLLGFVWPPGVSLL